MPSLPSPTQGTESSSGASNPIDVSGYKEVLLTLRVASVSGTDPTLNVSVDHSTDGVHWKSLLSDHRQGQFRIFKDTGSESILITKFSNFIRTSWSIGGTSPVFNFEIDYLGRS
jgi:hypothetical protein